MPSTSDDDVSPAQLREQIDSLQSSLNAVGSENHFTDKGTQILLRLKYQELADKGITLPFTEVGFRNYSQNEEDGILHYLFSLIGTTDRRVVELCAGDGIECNATNLIINHHWSALLVDGDAANVHKGRSFFAQHRDARIMSPIFRERWLTRDNVNDILIAESFTGELDLFSLDMDGNDYWIWEALDIIKPRVIIAECNPVLGTRSLTSPYAEDFKSELLFLGKPEDKPRHPFRGVLLDGYYANWAAYGGASLPALNKLAHRKGYRLIGTNDFGFNAFFLRNDIGKDNFPEVTVESCINPSHKAVYQRCWEALKNHHWQTV